MISKTSVIAYDFILLFVFFEPTQSDKNGGSLGSVNREREWNRKEESDGMEKPNYLQWKRMPWTSTNKSNTCVLRYKRHPFLQRSELFMYQNGVLFQTLIAAIVAIL